MTIQQLLREWPPGFGGVERVTHELASIWGGDVYCMDVQQQRLACSDPLPVHYARVFLPSWRVLGRLHLPRASRPLAQLMWSRTPLHGHLPSPAVLLLLLLARLLRPGRRVTAHWHCFLQPGTDISGRLFGLYQWFALRCLPVLSGVVTTSPVLAAELKRQGCPPLKISVLPCCLSAEQETTGLAMPAPSGEGGGALRIVFIGRLDSYKRLDWLMESLSVVSVPWRLSVVGDGPKRMGFERLAHRLFGTRLGETPGLIRFHGRLSEAEKRQQLASADVLVLPSDRSNEAFGIVQLEAMAAGRPALAFKLPDSGMGWVGQLTSLQWSQSPEGLAEILERLALQPELRREASVQARRRYQALFRRSVWRDQLQQLWKI